MLKNTKKNPYCSLILNRRNVFRNRIYGSKSASVEVYGGYHNKRNNNIAEFPSSTDFDLHTVDSYYLKPVDFDMFVGKLVVVDFVQLAFDEPDVEPAVVEHKSVVVGDIASVVVEHKSVVVVDGIGAVVVEHMFVVADDIAVVVVHMFAVADDIAFVVEHMFAVDDIVAVVVAHMFVVVGIVVSHSFVEVVADNFAADIHLMNFQLDGTNEDFYQWHQRYLKVWYCLVVTILVWPGMTAGVVHTTAAG